jgi:hypothetical protein
MMDVGTPLPTLSQIRNWDTEHLSQAANDWEAEAQRWETTYEQDYQRLAETDWQGRAREAALERAGFDLVKVRGPAWQLREAATAARYGFAQQNGAKELALDAVADAEQAGFSPTTTAVRSSGYLTLANQQRIWAQYSTYITGDDTQGLLVEHGIFAVSDRRAGLRDDITELSNAVHDAFVSTVAATPEQNVHASNSPGTGNLPLSDGTDMAIFRVGFFSEFDCGYDAVLVGADRNGMRMLQSAVRSAHDDGAASFEFDAIEHHVVRQDGAADIELGSQTVVWRFDDAQLVEMLDLIEPLVDTEGAGHQYVDLNSPAETLILSVDEYTHGGPFAVFPHGEPVPPFRLDELPD